MEQSQGKRIKILRSVQRKSRKRRERSANDGPRARMGPPWRRVFSKGPEHQLWGSQTGVMQRKRPRECANICAACDFCVTGLLPLRYLGDL